MNKFKKTSLGTDLRDFFFSLLILGFFAILVFIVASASPKNAYAIPGCSLSNSHRCDAPCYCPVPGNPLANPDYCKYCATNDQCNACEDVPPPTITPASGDCATGSPGERAVCYAKTQLGDPWVLQHPFPPYSKYTPPAGADSYDCSGLVNWSWFWGTDQKLSMTPNAAPTTACCTQVIPGNYQPGDIYLWTGKPSPDAAGPGHVAMYEGPGMLIQSYGSVTETPVGDMYPPDSVWRPK